MDLQIIQNKIFEVRGCRVMLDFHLAELYGVQTKALDELVTNCDQLPENLKHSYILPDCFTEQGVAMLSSVLRSQTAIDVNISIMRAFVLMRQMSIGYEELLKRIEELEQSTDAQFSEVYQALTQLLSKPEPKPRKPIGYKTYDE